MVFDGGEKRHDKNCFYYPESRTKMYDDLKAKLSKQKNKIDEIILFIMEEDQSFSDDDTYSSDNFSSQIVQKLEDLKKECV